MPTSAHGNRVLQAITVASMLVAAAGWSATAAWGNDGPEPPVDLLAAAFGCDEEACEDQPAAEPAEPAGDVTLVSDQQQVELIPSGAEETNAVSPLTEVLLNNGRALLVTQALEFLPTPAATPQPFESPSAPNEASALTRPIFALTLDGSASPELVEGIGRLEGDMAIKDESLQRFGSWSAPASEASLAPARFANQTARWAAPASYNRPLYFEQPNLERYGHYVAICEKDNLTQSAISAAHFFATVPVLPYKMGAESPDECNYVLGSYRPGSCNPHQLTRPELSFRGLIYEGLTATGLVFFLP